MSITGSFYIIQLIPEIAPGRIKLGYTENLPKRLRAHQTTCPNAHVLKTWHCPTFLEGKAIATITSVDCKKIGPEVFDVGDLSQLIQRAETFFQDVALGRIALDGTVSNAELETILEAIEASANQQPVQFLTAEEAALELGRAPRTIRVWMNATQGDYCLKSRYGKVGRTRVVSSKEVAKMKVQLVRYDLLQGKEMSLVLVKYRLTHLLKP